MWPLHYLFLNAKNKKNLNINSKIDFSFPKCLLYLSTHLFLKFLSFGYYDILHPSLFSLLWLGFLFLSLFSICYSFFLFCFQKLLSNHVSSNVLKGPLNENFCHMKMAGVSHTHLFFSSSLVALSSSVETKQDRHKLILMSSCRHQGAPRCFLIRLKIFIEHHSPRVTLALWIQKLWRPPHGVHSQASLVWGRHKGGGPTHLEKE